MSKTLYGVINPVVKFILSSKLHGMMSRNTVLLEFKGRKSGKTYTTPVSYHETNGQLHCFTDKANKWWLNLQAGEVVGVTLRGSKMVGKPSVLANGSEEMQTALHDLLVASPRDADHAGVTFDAEGLPVASDVARASNNVVFISIALQDRVIS